MKEYKNYTNSDSKEFNSDIDLISIARTIYRGKIFVISVCSISTLISLICAYRITPVYQGEVNIVMRKEKTSSPLSNSGLTSKFGLEVDSSKKTEELILKSSSVLMPVYNFVKQYYEDNGIEKNNFTYKKWVNKEFKTNFVEDSNVLKILYKNSDKDLILRALNLITAKYQTYSTLSTEKKINNSINYLEIQRDVMINKSNSSMNELNRFSIRHGLGDVDGFVKLSPSSSTSLLSGEDSEEIKIAAPKSGQRFDNQFQLLQKYEASYLDLSSKLLPNSRILRRLKIKIDKLKSSLERPNEILVKYRELYRNATRDEILLSNIEKNLELFKIDKLKINQPWEIISQPSIGEYPIYPSKKSIVFGALLTALLFSSLIIILREKIEGKIFEKRILEKLLNVKFLETFYLKNKFLTLDLIAKILGEIKSKETKIIDIINFSSFEFSNLKNSLTCYNFSIDKELKLNNEFKIDNPAFIFIEPGFITNENIMLINSVNELNENKIIGWFLLDKDTRLI